MWNFIFCGFLIACLISWSRIIATTLDGVDLCQSNCVSSNRLSGPTRMTRTRDHPFKIVEFPSKTASFCKLGCQMFFSEYPTNFTCKRICDYQYRYKVTTGYSDIAEEAILECKDGCEIALQVCQAGYYCTSGVMTECPAGRYRAPVPNVAIVSLDTAHECVDCPYGRYRSAVKGRSIGDCDLCPIGKYANVTGSTSETDCLRCPAGKFAEERGMRLCKCITAESCDLELDIGQGTQVYYKNNVDFYRESVPYIGRW